MRLTPASFAAASLAPLAFSTLIACGDDGSPSDSDTSDISEIETTPDGGDTSDSDTPPMTGEIDGTWAMVETQTALVEVLGALLEQRSVSYYRAVIADGKLTVGLCDWRTAGDLYTTSMRPALLEALDTFDRDLTVTANGAGFDIATTQGVTTRGVNLSAPLTDTMPTDATDERVVDQDGDTNPGISLVITGALQGELYVIHRHKASLTGALESDTRISGRTAWTTDQVILGSTPPTLAEQDPKPQTHPDPSKSTFVMVKAEASDDCAALNAKRSTLFP